MVHVLVSVRRGIIDRVTFFETGPEAVAGLADFVKGMNPDDDDAAVFSPRGLVANAKVFLDPDE